MARPIGMLIALCLLIVAGHPAAQEQETRRAQAVSKAVYDKIQLAQTASEADDDAAAEKILAALIATDKLTGYEQSQVLQYLGFLQHKMGATSAAISSFEDILLIEGIEAGPLKQSIYTLAQLSMAIERYPDAIRYLERWFSLEPNPGPEPHILYGQCLYQVGRHADMISPIEAAIEIAASRGMPVKEDWYALLNFAYLQVEEYAKLRDALKSMLVDWPRERYWMTLAGAYSALGEENNLANAFAVAHTQGFLEAEAEIVTMAQLYLQREVPYLAAQLLQAAIDAGSVSQTEKNYRLLSQAWTLAQEDERSIPALQQAARLSDDGELGVRLGNAFLSVGRYDDCVVAVRSSQRKGGLKNPDHAQISLGMCLYNLREYAAASEAFSAAREIPRSAATAGEWLRIIAIDMQRDAEIKHAEGEAQKRLQSLAERRRY